MSLTGKFLTKKREEIDSESADIHPFSRVKPKRKKNILIFILVFSTIFVYTAIFVMEIFPENSKKSVDKKEIPDRSKVVLQSSKKEEVKNKKEKKLDYPPINISSKELGSDIQKSIQKSKVLTLIPEKVSFKKEKTPSKKESKRDKILNYIKKGKEAEKRGDIKSAIYFYKEAWKLNKSNSDLIFKIADLHYKGGYYKATIKYANRTLKIKNDYIPAIVLKAKAYESLGMKEKSKTILEEAYFMYPENKEIILNLARLYEKERSLVIAKDLYKILDEMGYVEGSLGLARINEKLGNKDEAYRIYKKLLKRSDISKEMRYRIEEKLLILGD
ncbi:tetratricopeptide repeat protein [Persephonella sp.]